MAGDSRRSTRSGAGPGRGSPRSRTAARTGTRTSTPRSGQRDDVQSSPESTEVRPKQESKQTARVRAVPITRRAVALFVVLIVLGVSYASSLRVYMNQQRDFAETRAQIAERSAAIDSLTDQLDRWKDPAYVRTQARERLAWVIPGETGYVVLGEDGQPIDGSATIGKQRDDQEQPDADAWWVRMWGGVQAADHPAAQPVDEAPAPKASKSPR